MALANQKGRFGADEAAVVLELRFSEVTRQNGVDHPLPSVQVLLELPSVVSLTEEQRTLVKEGLLKRRRQHKFTQTSVYTES